MALLLLSTRQPCRSQVLKHTLRVICVTVGGFPFLLISQLLTLSSVRPKTLDSNEVVLSASAGLVMIVRNREWIAAVRGFPPTYRNAGEEQGGVVTSMILK